MKQENVAKEGSPEELKYCLVFQEDINPMVLNMTNARMIASITGSEETEEWNGHKLVLYNDPNVSFGGKIMGGIRVRAPKQKPKPPQHAQNNRAQVQPAKPIRVSPPADPEMSEELEGQTTPDDEPPF